MKAQTFKNLLLAFLISVIAIISKGQTTITGSSCVIPELATQYNISGKWTANSTVQICVKNGKLQSTGTPCYNGKPVSYIRVIWDNSGTNGSISLTSADGNASHSVKITRPLRAGIIDAASEKQEIEADKIPSTISCSPALWGGCNPVYQYQWQQSIDRVTWVDINNAISQNLKFTAAINESKFYRRKVTETNSRTIKYSQAASVLIIPKVN